MTPREQVQGEFNWHLEEITVIALQIADLVDRQRFLEQNMHNLVSLMVVLETPDGTRTE